MLFQKFTHVLANRLLTVAAPFRAATVRGRLPQNTRAYL